MSKIFQTGILAALVASVAGHTEVEKFEVGGRTYPGFYQPSKQDPGNKSPAWWTNQGWGHQPVFGSKLNHPDIIAHFDAKPSPYTVEAPAGGDVTFTWHHVLLPNYPGPDVCNGGTGEEGWDCSHHGWTATYMAPCPGDCKDVIKTDLEFFKIHESVQIDPKGTGRYSDGAPKGNTGYWGTDEIFYANKNKQSVTIPKGIPSGNYVLRTEVVSIHNNGDVSERQFWPQAFNIKVTGGKAGAQMPAGTKGTELYRKDDPCLKWNMYWHDGKKLDTCGIPLASVARGLKARSHPKDFSS